MRGASRADLPSVPFPDLQSELECSLWNSTSAETELRLRAIVDKFGLEPGLRAIWPACCACGEQIEMSRALYELPRAEVRTSAGLRSAPGMRPGTSVSAMWSHQEWSGRSPQSEALTEARNCPSKEARKSWSRTSPLMRLRYMSLDTSNALAGGRRQRLQSAFRHKHAPIPRRAH